MKKKRIRTPEEKRLAINKANAKWKKKNPDYMKAYLEVYQKEWDERNPGYRSKHATAWRKNNPEKFKISQDKYSTSEKGKATRARYYASKHKIYHHGSTLGRYS